MENTQPKPLVNAEESKKEAVVWETSSGEKLVSRRFPTRVYITVQNNRTGKYQYKHTYSISVTDLSTTAFQRAVGLELGRRLAYAVREKQGQRLTKEEIQTILDTLNGVTKVRECVSLRIERARKEEQIKNCTAILQAGQLKLAKSMFDEKVISKASLLISDTE